MSDLKYITETGLADIRRSVDESRGQHKITVRLSSVVTKALLDGFDYLRAENATQAAAIERLTAALRTVHEYIDFTPEQDNEDDYQHSRALYAAMVMAAWVAK